MSPLTQKEVFKISNVIHKRSCPNCWVWKLLKSLAACSMYESKLINNFAAPKNLTSIYIIWLNQAPFLKQYFTMETVPQMIFTKPLYLTITIISILSLQQAIPMFHHPTNLLILTATMHLFLFTLTRYWLFWTSTPQELCITAF